MGLPPPPSAPSATAAQHDAYALAPLIEDTFRSPLITFYLNGRKTVLSNPNPRWTLLDYIRAQPNLKGTKLGCGEGGCGACTVVLQIGSLSGGKKKVSHLAVNACLFPLVGVDGKHVITIEGLGTAADPHPLQERIAKMHGSQCGFCTPGIVMSLYALVRNSYDPERKVFMLSERDIEMEGHLDGNLCRCTGYKPILQAAKTFVTEDLKGAVDETSQSSEDDLETEVLWFRPVTVEQLLEVKSAYAPAKLVVGSSEVQVEIRLKSSKFPVMVYVSDIEELKQVSLPTTEAAWDATSAIVLGANTPLTEVENICKEAFLRLGKRGLVFEALRKQLRYFAGRQIRNVASLAGNIATASPISDANPVLLAAGASLSVARKGQPLLTLHMKDFFLSYRKTALIEDGIIAQIRIPLPPIASREVMKAYKQAKRKDDDIAIVTAGFRVRLDVKGLVEDIALAFGGMAPITIPALKTQQALMGKMWEDQSTMDTALASLRSEMSLPFGVPGGMAQYRMSLVCSFFIRFWHESLHEFGLRQIDPSITEIHRDVSHGTRDSSNFVEQRVVGKNIPHLSALKQCTGEAEYVDDIPRQESELFGGIVFSTKAHAKLLDIDWKPALELPGVVGYIDKNDLRPELNVWGSVRRDEPFFADGKVESHGQVIGMVYAETALQAQAAAKAVKITYEDLPVIVTIDEAIKAGSFFTHGRELRKGKHALASDMAPIFTKCDKIFEGTTRIGGQEQFYLETNAALAIPSGEDGQMDVWSSTQNTMETQEFVSLVTGVSSNKINAKVKRLGGGFGGKESRSVPIACLCAIAAKKERRPVRVMLNRDEDMMTTGQRHPIQARWKVGVMNDGRVLALDADVYNNAGFSYDMSGAVMDRCLTHIDNCYEIPDVWVRGHLCKTNTHSNTAFRGFGGPQSMYLSESIMSAIAEGIGMDIDDLRLKNLYTQGNQTPFLQTIDEDWHVPIMMEQLRKTARYEERKAQIKTYNSNPKNKWKRRGICMIPTKFGLSFATALHLNQAGAYVKIYADGSVLLHHGGTEMGQGLYTKMCQVAAQELNVPIEEVYTQDSQSYQIANASPTAASSGSDLNGMAVKNACDQLNERLAPYRKQLGPDATMKDLAHAAYRDRVNLAANGFWKMPKIGYTWGNFKDPKPMYYYFTQGVGVSEVELDLLTGDHTVLRTDIMMDVGNSINPAIDYGQIEGAFVQGQGLFTMEEALWFSKTGNLATMGPGNYKIPGFSDIPQEFNVSMLRHDINGEPISWKHLRSIQSSKGTGEPPLFLGSTVFFALREAVKAARESNGLSHSDGRFSLDSPATAETLSRRLDIPGVLGLVARPSTYSVSYNLGDNPAVVSQLGKSVEASVAL
ncbi:putative xanthine dehydrogenase protein [Phaeoacremonium minimum UCRPA7]|uniref:Putative xanthine dehydrogenase protein n=1 Tax=Phaeoacremonium minimum (strain UCR-PA7) TaxID=1286976 RepID=R8BMA6_PHAM7|nr:putative xanthine dehydrogenase protein [Phaeoacremonium minimum UCRPA7]EOO00385.1 putative xanthine dehydrogenase protein [Phaeoacremonium minimum UCRPA7]